MNLTKNMAINIDIHIRGLDKTTKPKMKNKRLKANCCGKTKIEPIDPINI